jgi:hypothetical protein
MLDAKADNESCKASDNQHKQGNVLKTYVHRLLALLLFRLLIVFKKVFDVTV